MSNVQWKSFVKGHIQKYVHSSLCKTAESMSKTKHVIHRDNLEQHDYFSQLPSNLACRAFEVRLSMLDINVNYKNKYKTSKIEVCAVKSEHIIS